MNLDQFIRQNDLPAVFAASAQRCYLPFADWLEGQLAERQGDTYVLGINGAQGTGKSTLAQLLSEYLASEYGRRVVVLSLDDIYLTRAERLELGERVHPLLATRGVPGTHDVELGISVIDELRALKAGETARVPRFDKSRDDRFPSSDWTAVTGPVDLVIFEGWCVASQASPAADLQEPINELEATADAAACWRTYVNDQLASDYVRLFASLDSLLFLRAPDFDCVLRWRREQEHKLKDRTGSEGHAVMSDAELAEFIQHYERITRNNFAVLPSKANAVIELGEDHQAISLRYPRGGMPK